MRRMWRGTVLARTAPMVRVNFNSGLGMLAAVLPLLSPEKGLQMTNIIKALVLLVSGVYYEISVLPAWMQPLSKISPAYYMLVGMREALLKGAPLFATTNSDGRRI